MRLMPVALPHVALNAQKKNVQNVSIHQFQHVNATKIANLEPLMPTVAATSTIVNVTPTSATRSLNKLAQAIVNELKLEITDVVQSSDVLRLQSLLQTHQLQPLISKPPLLLSHSNQHVSVSIQKVANEHMVRAGLLHLNHATSTLVVPSMTSQFPPSSAKTMYEKHARPLNANKSPATVSAALGTLVSLLLVKRLYAPKFVQLANTMKI
jgi:hypothetical protein